MTKSNEVVASAKLKAILERLENLDDDRVAVMEDMKAVMKEAKAEGFDPKTVRRVLRLRRMAAAERTQQAELLGMYCEAVGMKGLFL